VISIIPLTSFCIKNAALLYSQVFLNDEPTTLLHDPDPSQFLSFAEFYVQALITKNLSFVARDDNSSDIIGFIFCLDLLSDIRDEGEEMVCFLNQFKETVAMMENLEEKYLDLSQISFGNVVHVFQIGVHARYRRSGIAKSLITRVIENGKKMGYSQIIADCTSMGSVCSFESCGFVCLGSIPYESFTVDGNRFFSDLPGDMHLVLKNI